MLQPIQIFLCIGVILAGVILIKKICHAYKNLTKYLIDVPIFGENSLKFNGQDVKYTDIKDVQIHLNTSDVEVSTRFFAGGACSRLNYDAIIITLRDDSQVKIPTIRRKTLHKYLVELGKHIKLDINAEEYKEPFATGYELLILLIVIFWIISEFIQS